MHLMTTRITVLLLPCFLLLHGLLHSMLAQASGAITHFDRFSLNEGLSQATITAIVQDRQGFLWFATKDGLNRYDGYTFRTFHHDPQDPGSIANSRINTLYLDSKGRLWVGTHGGLNRFDADSERFVRFSNNPSNPHSLSHNHVRAILEDHQGILWLGTSGGGLNRFDESTGEFIHFKHDDNNPGSLAHDHVWAIHEDSKDRLWLGTTAGLSRYDATEQTFHHYQQQRSSADSSRINAIHEDRKGRLWLGSHNGLMRFDVQNKHWLRFNHQVPDPRSLSHNLVRTIFEDSSGTLWIGTHGGGLSRYDPQQQGFVHFRHHAADPNSLSNDNVLAIHEDNQGALWIGTFGGGLSKLDRQRQRFNHFKHQSADPHSLSHNNVYAIHKNSKGSLWVGTDDGLNHFDAKTRHFVHFSHSPANARSLSGNGIKAIHEDDNGILWIGTNDAGLNKYDPQTRDFVHFKHQPSNPHSLSHNTISAIHRDKKGRLWLGTYGGGLNRFDPQTARFVRYRHQRGNPHSLSHDVLYAIHEDSDGTLWLGTDGGLDHFDATTNRFTHYRHQPDDPRSLSHDGVRAIHRDRNGILWIATRGGLNRFNPKNQLFTHYRVKDGLPNDAIYGILEDPQNRLWLSTTKGLSRFDPDSKIFHNFDVRDGLQSNEFNSGAYFQGSNGELFFGGINGFNRFFPADIHSDAHKPEVMLTDFRLFNKSVTIKNPNANNDNAYHLTKAIGVLDQLTLDHRQNLFSFEFAALHFTNPMKNQYAYQLSGWDKQWIATDGKKRWATYTNLPAGDYTLRIKASNSDGHWNEQGKSLKITILSAPWKSWWAYSIYAAILIALAVAYVYNQRQKVRYERSINLQLKQVDKLKDEFLANTSHELRTPLNGIIGLAESLMDGIGGPQSKVGAANLAMIVNSGKRLSNLVNDILDFSKLKNNNLTLNTGPVDLHGMVNVVLTLSQPFLSNKALNNHEAANKKLKLINAVPTELPSALADEDRLQQILHNLVDNAIKFTDHGEITVSAMATQGQLTVSVTDSGIGIAESRFDSIFNSFEQARRHNEHGDSAQGLGLGLAVSRQLVELHGGNITVGSTLDQGSTFSFTLPVASARAKQKTAETPLADARNKRQIVSRLHCLDRAEQTTDRTDNDGSRFRILLVDDEPVNRRVLHNHLSLQNYRLVEATGGEQALDAIFNHGPFDLVLLDIMMPKVSGYEVCKKIRERYPVNDLPVIFLTAKNQIADLVQSFAVGANDYLSKPISKHELLTRVEIHLKFLDINRNLEQRVAERTTELEQKHQEVEQKNREIIATQQQLVQTEKMASLGTLTAGIAHEINNPTNFVHVSVFNLDNDLQQCQQFIYNLAGDDADEAILEQFKLHFEPLHQHLATIKNGTERIKTIVQDLRAFSQLGSDTQQKADISNLLQSTINLVRTKYQEQAEFITDFQTVPELLCYPTQLNQVFMNLMVNACDAVASRQQQSKQPGKIIITCRFEDNPVDPRVIVTVEDNGCGMTVETKTRLFEPFYSTKGEGGTGLGLSISYGIVQKHQGQLLVKSDLELGTVFSLYLPFA